MYFFMVYYKPYKIEYSIYGTQNNMRSKYTSSSNSFTYKVLHLHTDCAAFDLNLIELTFRNPNRSLLNYKQGTTFDLVCKDGLMTSEVADSYTIDHVVVTCQGQDKWQADDVNCWKGQCIIICLFCRQYL